MAQHHALTMYELGSSTKQAAAAVCFDEDAAQHEMGRSSLRAALHDAQQESAARARIMATVGHDLRQPLHAAMLMIDRVRLGVDQAASARLDQAMVMLVRLGDGLGQLAQASQSDFDRVSGHTAFPVGELLEQLFGEWADHATSLGIVLRVRPSTLRVVSNRTMLATILRNLVGNAIKYSSRGGRVLVGCRRRGAALQLQVLDDGPGIAADKMTMIFEAFRRIDPADQREGLGLGLSIVKRTAEALGHGLEVRTALNRGSCFGVSVPLDSIYDGAL